MWGTEGKIRDAFRGHKETKMGRNRFKSSSKTMKLDGRVYWQSIDHQLCFPDRLFTLFSYSCIICVCTFLHNVTHIVNIFKGHVTLRSFSKTIYPTGTFCIFMLCFSYSQKSNLGVKKRHKKTFCKLVVDLLSLIFYIFHIYIYIFFYQRFPCCCLSFQHMHRATVSHSGCRSRGKTKVYLL